MKILPLGFRVGDKIRQNLCKILAYFVARTRQPPMGKFGCESGAQRIYP